MDLKDTIKNLYTSFRENPRGVSGQLFQQLLHSSFFLGPKQNSIGVSIGHKNVIAVEIDQSQQTPRLVNFSVKQLMEGGPVMSSLLADMFSQGGFTHPFVKVSLSGKSVIVRFVKLPKMNKKELRSALEFEAERYIPFELNQVYLDFDIIRADVAKKFTEVVLVVAKTDAVDELITECKMAALQPTLIDVDCFACYNAFLAAYPHEVDKPIALVNIGAKLTNLLILSQGLPAFTRDIYFGGDDVAANLSKKLDIPVEVADALQCNLQNAQIDNIKVIIREILSYLVNEMKLSLDYFESQFQKQKVEAIYLIGGASQLDGLVDIFNETLGVPTQHFDPLRCVVVDESLDQAMVQKYAPSLAVPIGLAMRSK